MKPTTMTAPLVTDDTTLQQLFIDMRTQHLLAWDTAVVLFDSSVGGASLDNFLRELRSTASITVIDLGDANKLERKTVRDKLGGMRPYDFGNKFLAVVSKNVVETVFDEVIM